MKKVLMLVSVFCAMLLTACSNSADKKIDAIKDATVAINEAPDDFEKCRQIGEELKEKLNVSSRKELKSVYESLPEDKKNEFSEALRAFEEAYDKVHEASMRTSDTESSSENSSYSYTDDSNDDEEVTHSDTDETTSSEEPSVAENADSEDWDEVLASYEEYVDKYIEFAKRAKNGDMDALMEYADLLKQAQEYWSKLEKAKSDLSSSQLSKLLEITNKMNKAATDF